MDNYKDRNVIISHCAHLTEPKQVHLNQDDTTLSQTQRL